jgi:uncharacterized protein (DUF2147 family)
MRAIAGITLFLATAAQAQDAPIEGRWRSPGGNTIIEIADCGSALCGTVAWASEKSKKAASKTTSQLIGTQLITGLEEKKPGRWQGKLFIPDKNMRVVAKIQLLDAGQLKVGGCAAGVICKSEIWKKYDAPLPE